MTKWGNMTHLPGARPDLSWSPGGGWRVALRRMFSGSANAACAREDCPACNR